MGMSKKKNRKSHMGRVALGDLTEAFKKKEKVQKKFRVARVHAADVWARMEGAKPVVTTEHEDFAGRVRKKLLSKKNHGEKVAAKMLNAIGANYEREKPFRVGRNLFFADFFVRSFPIEGASRVINVVLEVDGSVHEMPDVQKKDVFKNKTLIRHPEVNAILRITVPDLKRIERVKLREALKSITLGQVVYFRM